MERWEIARSEVNERLDGVVARRLQLSVHEARRLIADGFVRVNGAKGTKGMRLPEHAQLEVRAEVRIEGNVHVGRSYAVVPEAELLLDVLYEDEQLVAVDKPAGWATHPLKPGERGTVANALAARFPGCATASPSPREGGLVHRLDRDTSGVLLAAKTPEAFLAMRQSFSDGLVDKTYWALVHGTPVDRGLPGIVVDVPLVTRGGLARVDERGTEGLPARTELRVLVSGEGHALIEAKARTGRLHQIRAHVAHLGHPLVGDTRYGAPLTDGLEADRALLHARTITLPHPRDGWRLTCAAPLPRDRRALFERLLGRPLPADR